MAVWTHLVFACRVLVNVAQQAKRIFRMNKKLVLLRLFAHLSGDTISPNTFA
jgi:hypothetical protein